MQNREGAMVATSDSGRAPNTTVRVIDGYEASWFGPEESSTPVGHWVYRAPRSGPSVIVIHEATGLTSKTLGVAARVLRAGMTPVLPLVAGRALPGRIGGWGVFAKVCLWREFGALANGEATPTTSWIRALARKEERDSGCPVGVIGMCFSGGYAFAAALDASIRAVVSSQPAFPAAIGGRRRQFGINRADLPTLKANTGNGNCVRTLRYQHDFMSPGVRHDAIGQALPGRDPVEIRTWNPFDHAVLGNAVSADPESPLGKALTDTVAFLRARLICGSVEAAPDVQA
jgi:dienelactone hydrolase